MFLRLLKKLNPWSSLAGLSPLSWWLALATFINRAGSMVLPFLLLYLIRYLGWKATEAAWVVSLYGLCAMLAGPISGRLCGRFGSGKVACCSLASGGVVMLLFPLAHSKPSVVLATVVLALCGESFRPANLALQAEIQTSELRQIGFTLNRLAANAGISIGPALGGLLAALWFPAIFLVDGASALLASLLMARHLWGRGGRHVAQSSTGQSVGPLTDARLRRALAGSFLVHLAFCQIDGALALTMVSGLGMSERQFGLIFTVNTLFIVLFEVAINQRTAKWRASRTLFLGATLVGLGLGGTALVRDLHGLLLASVVWTVGEILFFPSQLSRIADLASEENMGATMGCLTSSAALAYALGPMLGVPLLMALGQAAFWSLVLVICVLGGVCAGLS